MQHSASETDFNFERVIPMAQQWIRAGPKVPILARLDARFDSVRLMCRPEFKTDLDLTRLPSGKFDTSYLVFQLAALAMNILRLMGQRGLLKPDAPVRHSAKRRRIKTVMQELIYRAGRLILGLGANDRAATAFKRVDGELFAACR